VEISQGPPSSSSYYTESDLQLRRPISNQNMESPISCNQCMILTKLTNSVASVRERTIPTERPPMYDTLLLFIKKIKNIKQLSVAFSTLFRLRAAWVFVHSSLYCKYIHYKLGLTRQLLLQPVLLTWVQCCSHSRVQFYGSVGRIFVFFLRITFMFCRDLGTISPVGHMGPKKKINVKVSLTNHMKVRGNLSEPCVHKKCHHYYWNWDLQKLRFFPQLLHTGSQPLSTINSNQ
jgi:hypothetical protein